MRVIVLSRERGATSAIVALFLSAALGLGALVIDVGNSWQERRHTVTATDAAALAAAQDYVRSDPGCSLSASPVVVANNPDATMTACNHVGPTASTPGRVTVDAEADVDFVFAGILGFTDTTVSSSTTVKYDIASSIHGGLRPFGLCLDVVNTLGMTPGDGVVYRIYYGKDDQPSACNGGDPVPGNWGILDFNGGANGTPDLRDWTENGYDGEVTIGDWIEGNPGAFSNSLNSELQHLVDNVDSFTLPVFTQHNDLGGSNAEFLIGNFAVVKLHDFKTTGAQNDRYLDIEFLDDVVQGSGGGSGPGLGAHVIEICAVDGVDPVAACS